MKRQERTEDPYEAMLAALTGWQAAIWTALPCIIQSYDPIKMTCTAQPALMGKYVSDAPESFLAPLKAKNPQFPWIQLPILVDVPVVFPQGGGYTLTFPVTIGDEALVVFSSRCIDAWWQSGGIQTRPDLRMHDLSDGFAFVGVRSQPRVLPNVSNGSVQLRSDDGISYVELTDGHIVNIVAPGGINLVGNVAIIGAVVASGEGTFNGGHTVSAHIHSDPQGGNVGPPTG